MTRLLLVAVFAACAASAQPVVNSRAVGAEVPNVALAASPGRVAAPAQWAAPPGLYWAVVAVDAAALAGGAYLLVQGVRLLGLAGDESAGFGAVPVAMFGGMALGVGAGAVVWGGYDAVRVLSGDDPALARLFDPTRPPPAVPPRPHPFPEPPGRPDL